VTSASRLVAGVQEKEPVLAIPEARRGPRGRTLVDGPRRSWMDTVPAVVGVQVMAYGAPTGTASPRAGLAIGLQLSVHMVVYT
jgi:hypothetical protein